MQKPIEHLPDYSSYKIDVLRLDLIHPEYGGNKYFKLKYNILKAKEQNANPIVLTFGGPHSNHIYSTAAYCEEHKIKCIGVIRGEESTIINSPTLQFAQKKGMLLHFVSRNEYDSKSEKSFTEELKEQFGNIYIIPEGGNNSDGVKGCAEILTNIPLYDYVFCACGTACTFTGIYSSLKQNQIAVGISVLKGENELINDVNKYADEFQFQKIKETINYPITTSCILNNFHFGGYAKHTQELIDFKRNFEMNHKIPLDYVYTAKLFYAVYSLIDNNKLLPNKKLLIVHSGGQQGNRAYEQRYKINM